MGVVRGAISNHGRKTMTTKQTTDMIEAIRHIETMGWNLVGWDWVNSSAADWLDAGFTVETAEPWWAVDCFNAVRAAAYRDAGIDPADMSTTPFPEMT